MIESSELIAILGSVVTEEQLSFPADLERQVVDLAIMRDWLDASVDVPGANLPEFRYAEWREMMDVAHHAASRAFPSREAADRELFEYRSGGGFGVPTVLRHALLDLLLPSVASDPPLELLRAVIEEMGRSKATLDRLALASTNSQGESAWVSEASFHATAKGLTNHREVTRGGIPRIDLFLEGTAVEFKSQHSVWAFKETDEARAQWWGHDIAKLGRATVPGVMVITTVTLTDELIHQRPNFRATADLVPAAAGASAPEIQARGLDSALRFLASRCASTVIFDLGYGSVPGSGGRVLLGCVAGLVANGATASAL